MATPTSSEYGPDKYVVPLGITLNDRYYLESTVGIGSSAHVFRARDRRGNHPVAIKVPLEPEGWVFGDDDTDTGEEFVIKHLQALSASRGPRSFVHVLDAFTIEDWYSPDPRRCIVMPLLDTNLKNFLAGNPKRLTWRHVQEIARQLIEGLQFIHDHGWIHANIKPSNIVLHCADTTRIQRAQEGDWSFGNVDLLKSARIAIIDFDDAVPNLHSYRHVAGSIGYRAPEIWGGLLWGSRADIFSLSCVIAELHLGTPLIGRDQLEAPVTLAIMDAILGPFSRHFINQVRAINPSYFPTDPRDVINPRTPPLRYALSQLIQDRNMCMLLEGLLQLDPEKRVDLDTVLHSPYFKDNLF